MLKGSKMSIMLTAGLTMGTHPNPTYADGELQHSLGRLFIDNEGRTCNRKHAFTILGSKANVKAFIGFFISGKRNQFVNVSGR